MLSLGLLVTLDSRKINLLQFSAFVKKNNNINIQYWFSGKIDFKSFTATYF